MPPKPQTIRSIDGVAPRTAAPPHRQVPPAGVPHPQQPQAPGSLPPHRRTFAPPPGHRPRRRWWQALVFPLCILLCLSASFLMQSLPLGVAATGVYAVVAWLRRLPSRYSFVLAFLSLVTVIVLLVVRQNVELAGNFATYTFLLLVIGVVSSMIEPQAHPKRKRSKKPHLQRTKTL